MRIYFPNIINVPTVTPIVTSPHPSGNKEALIFSLNSNQGSLHFPSPFPQCYGLPISPNNLSQLIPSLRGNDNPLVFINGERVYIKSVLGKGGSKSVYDAEWNGNRFALALPNVVDSANGAFGKWTRTLTEPYKTALIRDISLCTNTFCDAVPAIVNNVEIPVVAMTRYEDLPYKVIDTKRRESSTQKSVVYPIGGLTVENFLSLFTTVVDDCVTLLKNGVMLHGDSINVCMDETGCMRLYLNDLGEGMSQKDEEKNREKLRYTCGWYADYAKDAWASLFDFDEIENNKAFFAEVDKSNDERGSISAQIADKIMEKI